MQCIIFFDVIGQTKALNIQDYYNCGLEDLDLKIVLHRSAARIISFCIPPPPPFFYKMKYTFYIAKKNVFTDARPLGNKRIINKNCYRSFWSNNLVKLKNNNNIALE